MFWMSCRSCDKTLAVLTFAAVALIAEHSAANEQDLSSEQRFSEALSELDRLMEAINAQFIGSDDTVGGAAPADRSGQEACNGQNGDDRAADACAE